ncbi:MAG: hypothetical protein UU93_C0008G0023 [Candidatus Amesbacteria bacterium GW2011_GWA2_42_12]|uniref:Uncharacterized protein n=1 Tax=Candidatus Amesbacteria bacterium GW2011_GWA2_42_12 TaxID=1618356 RepID=A0A0G1ADQ9_9BACT|nr:MAG: hypothetical protein UU93_C0008G0023 [Candidatus Amesbacteria bacterium GW2011_GWA2_42_12]
MAVGKHNIFHYLITAVYLLVKSILGSIVWIVLGIVGYVVFKASVSPYYLIIGFPLMLMSLGMVVNSLWSGLLSIFSLRYNQSMCVMCG